MAWSARQGKGSGSVAGVERTQWEDGALQSLRSATGSPYQKNNIGCLRWGPGRGAVPRMRKGGTLAHTGKAG